MPANTVQSVGNSTYTFTHPLLNGGSAISIAGVKLETEYFTSEQALSNSKVIPLLNGGAATLTNTVRAGKLTFKAIELDGQISSGDLIAVGKTLQAIGDSIGGVLRITTQINGATVAVSFLFCTVDMVPPKILAGNDIPEYTVTFNYQTYVNT